MIPNLLLQATEWNPQLFREIRGRLKQRNLVLTGGLSLLAQGIILLYFWMVLPTSETKYSRYFAGSDPYSYSQNQVLDALGNPVINWQLWWFDMFQVLSWLLPFTMLIAGVYMLIDDLAKEERRGTLNFIRLSPQSSQNILVGKLLGVPIVPAIAVALAVPLHGLAAMQSGVSAGEVVSIYLLAAATCVFFYTGAVFYAFLGGAHSWLGAIIVSLCYLMFFQIYQATHHYSTDPYGYLGLGLWFYIPIGSSLPMAVGFALVCLGVGTFWLWKSINRRFRNPNLTLVSKKHSYLITLCFEVMMFGFVFREVTYSYYRPTEDLGILSVFNMLWFTVMIAALTPHRQTLLDWARYRRETQTGQTRWMKQIWNRSLIKDLAWGEKSPAMLAIAINLMIPVVLFTPWIISWVGNTYYNQAGTIYVLRAIAGLGLLTLFLLVAAALAQLLLFMKTKRRNIFAVTIIGALTIIPPLFLAVLSSYAYSYSESVKVFWFFTAFGFLPLLAEGAAFTTVCFTFLTHLGALMVLTNRMTYLLRKAGESEFKALTASRA
ncbi:ABC transporter permease subunit [Pantanalinema rosaneae CENA516]|uniref:ABC transporter permease subunit n=1 Tax=Pantanalinema rosaneae TaxID=1620701 RepID=UPI003D6DDC62